MGASCRHSSREKRSANVLGSGVRSCMLLSTHCQSKARRRTGMKCLPASKISESNGVGLHDWHAEILAIRTFNRFLLDECYRILSLGASSEILILDKPGDHASYPSEGLEVPFQIKEDVKLHMYCSEAPCMSQSQAQASRS
jgi:hypothetical protein